jgi:putative copper resistance protein D
MFAALAAARFIHVLSASFVFGALAFPIYANDAQARASASARAVSARFRWPLILAVVVAILSALAWFALTGAQMADDPKAATDWPTLRTLLLETDFGRLWIIRVGVAVLLLVALLPRRVGDVRWSAAALSALLLASLAGTGHAQADTGWRGWLHVSADAAHLLAAGFWIGALPVLALSLGGAKGLDDRVSAHRMIKRFSTTALVGVAVLIASGVINTLLLIGSPLDLVRHPWGIVLLAKVALVAAMLAFAGVNRLRLTPALDGAAQDDPSRAVRQLRRNSVIELVLGTGVLALVAVLGMLSPTS